MSSFFRVHPWLDGANPSARGGPLFVPPGRVRGRIGNEEYDVFYVASTPAGAIAEAFGNFAEWSPDLFLGSPSLKGSVCGLTRYESDASLIDLDDPIALTRYGLKPSRVVTRHRDVTRAWALALFNQKIAAGVQWWSYHDPDWKVMGVWDSTDFAVKETIALTANYVPFTEARLLLNRSFVA
jgi:hypothetical protein